MIGRILVVAILHFVVFFYFVVNDSYAETYDFDRNEFKSLDNCLSKLGPDLGPAGTTCGGSIWYLRNDCLKNISNDDSVWKSCTNNIDGANTIGSCANDFAYSACSQIEQTQWIPQTKCSNYCLNSKDSINGLKTVYIQKSSITQCPRLYEKEINQINEKKSDEVIANLCSPLDPGKCARSISEVVAANIAKNGGDCSLEKLSEKMRVNLNGAIISRVVDPELFPPPLSQEVEIQSSIRGVIDSCQKKTDGTYYQANNLKCGAFTECLVNGFNTYEATSPIYNCKGAINDKNIRNCSTTFAQAVKNIYLSWLDTKSSPIVSKQKMNCTGFSKIDQVLSDISSKLEINDSNPDGFYRDKLIQRRDELGIVDDEDYWKYIAPSPSGKALDQAFETFNCGFAGSDKFLCCTNQLVDLSEDVLISTVEGINPNNKDPCLFDLPGGCAIRQSAFSNPILSFVTSQVGEQTGELQNLLAKSGGVPPCFVGEPTGSGSSCTCQLSGAASACTRYISHKDQGVQLLDCTRCMEQSDRKSTYIYTGIGCINASFEGIIKYVFSTGLGIAGTIALLCIIYAAFRMQMSQGNPEEVQKAQGLITSCIMGLMMILFSVLLLRVIGVDILRIPGFAFEVKKDSEEPTTTVTPDPSDPDDEDESDSTVGATPVVPTIALASYSCGAEPGKNEVYLYDEANFGNGPCLRLTVGSYNLTDPIIKNDSMIDPTLPNGSKFQRCADNWNDCIVSIKVGSEVKVTLYEHGNTGGTRRTYSPGEQERVIPNIGDSASFVIIEAQ